MYWEWIVRVDGVQLSNVINAVEVSVGAQNPLDQSMPATASVTVLGMPEGQTPQWYLGKPIEILVYQSGTFAGARIFFGRVTQQTTTPLTPDGTEVQTELNCESYLPLLGAMELGADQLPAATEYERIYSLLERQFAPSWAEQPSTMTWADIPTFYLADIKWEEWNYPDAYYRPPLKVPNWIPGDPDPSLQLEAASDPVDMLTHVVDLAMGTGAWMYEYFGGIGPEVWYLCRADLLSTTPKTIDIGSAALSYSLTDTDGIWDLYTEAVVSNSTVSASDANFDAMRIYGIKRLDLTSFAALEADLQTIATTKVAALSRPLPNLTSISVIYNELSKTDRRWHLGPGDLYLDGIPEVFGGPDRYRLRGLVFRGSREVLTVDWLLLNQSAMQSGPMWRNVSAALTWNDLTTTWSGWN